MVHWKKNLFFIWLSQFLSIAGFAFSMPFGPYYIQTMGVTDPLEVKLWTAAFVAAAPISLAVFGPIWGWVADRYGRRPMLLRASIGSVILLLLMGMARTPLMLVLLRVGQGLLTGTMTAAQTMVASHTPEHRSGFALGALSSGVFSGGMAGVALGGVFADMFGYSNAFFLAAGLLVAATLLVLFGTDEDFERTAASGGSTRERMKRGVKTLSPVAHILIPIAVVALLRRFDVAYLPLLIQEIHGTIAGSATRMGAVGATACAAGFLSGFFFGHLGDRMSPARLARHAAWLGALFMLPHAFAGSVFSLLALRFGMSFCLGGIEPMFHSLLARASPQGERGFIFGWASTMRAVGWGMAPLFSGAVATMFSVRAVYVAGAVLLVVFSLLVRRIVRD